MTSSRLRYSSIPRECQEFTRLEPQTSSLRSASVNYRQENNCRTLPSRRPGDRQHELQLPDTVVPDGGGRHGRAAVRRRPSQPTKLEKYLVHRPTDLRATDPAMAGCTKSASLPGHSGRQSPSSLDPLLVPPEDLASQLTLLDLPVFCAIQPDELSSCKWNKKNKREVAPNIVAFISRFNHVSFWTVQEILRHEDLRSRTDTLAHFIKVAKRLHELNNLNSEFAVISALQSAAIYRLSKTWAGLSRHTRQSFDRLADLFSDRDNWARLRDHMNSIALKHAPCIPYLGLYLTDLMMVDIAHPSSGGIDSDHRQFKMNNILRLLSELQQSSYDNLSVISTIQEYLSDVRYIDELQKFLEDDQFKLSERLEPNSPQLASSTSSKESVRSVRPVQSQHPDLLQELNLSPAKRSGASRGQRFVPGHRKSKSEGGNIFFSCAGSGLASPEVPSFKQGKARLRGGSCDSLEAEKASHYSLLDGSLLDDNSPCSTLPPGTLAPPPAFSPENESTALTLSPEEPGPLGELEPGTSCTFQGFVHRMTLIKDGRKPLVSSWQKYWLQLWGSSLVYFRPKPLGKNRDRRDFKSEPCKLATVEGWMVMLPEAATKSGDSSSFQLADPVMKNVYRFRDSGCDRAAWVYHLTRATRGNCSRAPPANLITFE